MKKISAYTYYCTPTQTRKALKLGAPLKTFIHIEPEFSMANGCLPYPEEIEMYEYPTTEWMIDWLEGQGLHFYAHKFRPILCHDYKTSIAVWETKNYNTLLHNDYFSSKEASFAAIDAALDYLIKTKNNEKSIT